MHFHTLRFMLASLIAVSLSQLIVASFLAPRQSGPINVPPACNSSCSELNTILQSCSSASCLCTQLLVNDFGTCFLCVGQLTNANFDTPQQTINQLVSECQQDGVTLTPVILPGEPSTGIASPSPNPPQGGSSSQGPSQGPSQSPSRSPSPSSSRSSSGASASTPPSAPKSSNPSASQQSSQSTTNSIQTVPSILPTPTSPSSTQSNDANLPSNTAPPASPDTNSADRIVFTTPLAVAIFGIILVLA